MNPDKMTVKNMGISNELVKEGVQREKTPAQTEILSVAFGLAQKKLESLGIPFHPPDPKRFIFLTGIRFASGGEWVRDNYVLINADGEANLSTILHESFHFLSSEFYHYGDKAVEQKLSSSRADVRSGFHGIFYEDLSQREKGEGGVQVTFRLLNEAVTEKMAREVTSENLNVLERLKPLFAGRKEEIIEKTKNGLKVMQQDKKSKTDSFITDQQAEMEASLKEVVTVMRQQGESEEVINAYEVESRQNIQERLRDMQKILGATSDFYESITAPLLDGIEKNYSFNGSSDAYEEEVQILDILLDGMAIVRAREEGNSVEEARVLCWRDMQKAYFQNNVMYLRKIEKVWGKDILRNINYIPAIHYHEDLVSKTEIAQELRDHLVFL